MTELYNNLKQLCDQAGTNLTALCDELKVSRSTVERWKLKAPLSLQIYFSLKNHLENLVTAKQTEVVTTGSIPTALVHTLPLQPSEKTRAQIYEILERVPDGFPEDQDIDDIWNIVIAQLSPRKT